MKLTFYRDGNKPLKVENERELLRANLGLNYYDMVVYLGNFRLGAIHFTRKMGDMKPDYCSFGSSGLGLMIPLKILFKDFVKFLGREDVGLEEFFGSSVRIGKLCLLEGDVVDSKLEKHEEFFAKVQEIREEGDYETAKYFKEQERPFSRQYIEKPFCLLFSTK